MKDPVPQEPNYEGHEDQPIVDVQAIASAYGEIIGYNAKRTSPAKATLRLVFAQAEAMNNPDNIIETAPGPDDDMQVDDIDGRAVEEDIQDRISGDEIVKDLMDLTNSDLFMHAGISIKQSGESVPELTKPEPQPHIVNNTLFAEFIQATPTEVDDTTKKLLEDIARNTAREIKALQEQGTPESREALNDRLFNFDDISQLYKERGIDTSPLDKYSHNWKRNTLGEYLRAEDMGILGDKPSFWHLDGFAKDWKDALPFVDELERDERTQELVGELKANLIRCLEKAKSEINDPGKSHEYSLSAIPSLDEIAKMLKDEPYDFEVIRKRWFAEEQEA